MSSSPLRKRRQSIRSPQRRVQSSRNQNETSFDPFLSTAAEPNDATILKQTLLAQLNARVSADNSNPFVFGQSVTKDGDAGTKRYDGKHDKIFKSMKSIAALRISDNPTLPIPRSQSKQDLSRIGSVVPTSAKRSGLDDHPVATPSKRRKVESITTSTSTIPKLSFNFDKARPAQQQSTASITASMSKLERQPFQKSPSRANLCNSPSRATLTTVNNDSAGSLQGHSKSLAVKPETISMLPGPTETRYPGLQEVDQKRQQKRQEQRKKGTVQRILAKSVLPRPGWK